jgi:hypothetical protein
VAAGLFLPGFAMVADGENAGRAVSRSIDAMKGDWLSASAFLFVFGFVVLASIVPCCLGLFATIPMYYLISALAYRDMDGLPMPPQPDFSYGAVQYGVWPPPPSGGGDAGRPDLGEPPFGNPPSPPAA